MQHETEIKIAIDKILKRREDVLNYQDAERGIYDVNLGSGKFRDVFLKNYYRFADNIIPRIINSVNDRLEIEDISNDAADENVQTNIDYLTKFNRLDAFQKQVHNSSMRDGSSFVLLTKNKRQKIKFTLQTADVFEVARNREDLSEVLAGVKLWHQDGNLRLTVYYADRIERYAIHGYSSLNYGLSSAVELKLFKPFTEDGEFSYNHDFGQVPVIAFLNSPNHLYEGISDIANIYPIQIALNNAVVNLLASMESWALPTRYIVGLMSEYDSEGKLSLPVQQNGSTWIFGDKEVKIGQLDSANLTMSLEVINDFRHEIARLSSVPIHLLNLTSTFPSGESLKVAEMPLIGKIRNKQCIFGNAWEDLMNVALLDDELFLSTKWKPAQFESQIDIWSVATLQKNAGVSSKQILRERGYSDEQIDVIHEEKQEEDNSKLEMENTSFDAGQI